MPELDLVWPELVLHVLAHLESTARLPSSVCSEAYLSAARQHVGPVRERALGADIPVLAAHLTTHERLSAVQLLIRLHPTMAAARRSAHLPLGSLEDESETNTEVRDLLLGACPVAAELVRCAALLEADGFSAWPLPDRGELQDRLEQALPTLWPVAPRLRSGRRLPKGETKG